MEAGRGAKGGSRSARGKGKGISAGSLCSTMDLEEPGNRERYLLVGEAEERASPSIVTDMPSQKPSRRNIETVRVESQDAEEPMSPTSRRWPSTRLAGMMDSWAKRAPQAVSQKPAGHDSGSSDGSDFSSFIPQEPSGEYRPTGNNK